MASNSGFEFSAVNEEASQVFDGETRQRVYDRNIIRDQLLREGLEAASISNVGPCTRCANDRFFSRRAAGGKTSGLQMSFIGFTE